jgi:hypothetical protein
MLKPITRELDLTIDSETKRTCKTELHTRKAIIPIVSNMRALCDWFCHLHMIEKTI